MSRSGDIVRIGGGAVDVSQNERVEGDVVAIGGNVNVDGEVTGDVVAVMGGLTLGPHAVVRGEVTAVGGPFKRDPQAQVFGKVNEVGIGANGQTIPLYGVNIRDMLFGSLASRVGRFATTLVRVLMFVLFALIVTAVAQRPVQQIAARISAEPVRAGLVGLLAEILFVPVLVVTILALVVSIIGIPLLVLVPFGIILIGIVMLVGFTGTAHMVGTWTLERFGRAERNPVPDRGSRNRGDCGSHAGWTFVRPRPRRFWCTVLHRRLPVGYLAWTVGFGAAIQTWLQMRAAPLRRRLRRRRRHRNSRSPTSNFQVPIANMAL